MFRELQARPDNKVCVDCSSRIPQWASCSYGTYMCLECSGIHRSLGVHISFVQSVTMDSWKNERFVAKMRAGGNAAFNDFLARQGVPAKVIKGAAGTTDPERVREKYHAKACALYKDKMDAVADGRSWDEPSPEPYQNLAPNAGGRGSAPSSGGGGGAFAMGGGGGAFAGGSGGSGGGGGGARMQGMGGGGGKMPGRSTEDEAWNMLSDWGKSAASLASKATESVKATTSDLATNVDLNSIGNVAYERAERARQAAVDLAAAQNLDEVGGKLTQTTTEAASMFGSFLGKAVSVASEGLKDTASVVGGTAGGGGWWGQQQQQQQGGGGNRTAEELGGTSTDPEGMEVMVGEDEQGYIARRTRLQAEAKARMAAKFGGGGGGGIGSSGGGGGGGGDAAQEASRSQQSRVDRLNSSGGSGGGGGKDKWADDDGWGDDGWGESSPSPAPAPAPSPRRAPAPAPSSSAMDEQAAAVAAMSGQTSQLSRYNYAQNALPCPALPCPALYQCVACLA